MQLPPESARNATRLTYGRYVARRARRQKLPEVETEVKTATNALAAAALAEMAVEEARQEALADRDATDDDLDDVAKRHRQTIEGRATNANRERPYRDIYPDGIEYYTAAPLAEQASRYALLTRRYEEHLPEGDPVRAEAGLIEEGLLAWTAATQALTQAEIDVALAKGKTARAVDAWEDTLGRVYFRLAERLGKAKAERFFPRTRRGMRGEPQASATGADAAATGGAPTA